MKTKTEKQRLAYNKRQKEQRARRLDDSYGPLTPATQCEICGRKRVKFHRDHDHQTDKSRGWLCPRCNMALGLFDDSITILKNAIDYLKHHQTQDRMHHRRRSRIRVAQRSTEGR